MTICVNRGALITKSSLTATQYELGYATLTGFTTDHVKCLVLSIGIIFVTLFVDLTPECLNLDFLQGNFLGKCYDFLLKILRFLLLGMVCGFLLFFDVI